jgi:DNA-directed RNA polymerase specialized sigma24 family protein
VSLRTDPGQRLAEQSGQPAAAPAAPRWARRARARGDRRPRAGDLSARACDERGLPEGEPALRRYLAEVARHVVIDVARALRAAKRDGRSVRLERSGWSRFGLAESQVAQAEPGPGTRAGDAEELARLTAAFQRLEPDHRRVIGLRRFEGSTRARPAGAWAAARPRCTRSTAARC